MQFTHSEKHNELLSIAEVQAYKGELPDFQLPIAVSVHVSIIIISITSRVSACGEIRFFFSSCKRIFILSEREKETGRHV